MPYPARTHREAVLEAALELLEQGGSEALSMRSLARVLGIKAPSLYRHFTDRAALEHAMADAVALRLLEQLERSREGRKPKGALREAARTYLHFARSHPALYALLLPPQPGITPPALSAALWASFERLICTLTGKPDDAGSAGALWAFLHGCAGLERAGGWEPEQRSHSVEIGLEALISGFSRR